jgi:hypothetical protein
MSDPLELDQEDFFHRISVDALFSDVTVLLQRKGVVDSDVEVALSTLNEKASKLGTCVVVLMPELQPDRPGAPGPEYKVLLTVQVIESPLLNGSDSGTGKSAESLATALRQLLHMFDTGGRNTFTFESMEPIQTSADKVSYGVRFARNARDVRPSKVATPVISPASGAAPQTITLTCATVGASIYYTTDGSPPFSTNAEAELYTAPFNLAAAATVRAAAVLTNYAPSNIAQVAFT